MLSELEALHTTLLELIATMRGLIAPDARLGDQVSATRLKLSRATTARARYLESTIYPWVLARDQSKARDICRLRESDAAERMRSSNHVGRWNGCTIAADWPGFKHDEQEMLAIMLARIDREKALLYPSLRMEEPVQPVRAAGR